MSVIESPPEDRLPVETYVAEYDDGMVKEAIEREIRRAAASTMSITGLRPWTALPTVCGK